MDPSREVSTHSLPLQVKPGGQQVFVPQVCNLTFRSAKWNGLVGFAVAL